MVSEVQNLAEPTTCRARLRYAARRREKYSHRTILHSNGASAAQSGMSRTYRKTTPVYQTHPQTDTCKHKQQPGYRLRSNHDRKKTPNTKCPIPACLTCNSQRYLMELATARSVGGLTAAAKNSAGSPLSSSKICSTISSRLTRSISGSYTTARTAGRRTDGRTDGRGKGGTRRSSFNLQVCFTFPCDAVLSYFSARSRHQADPSCCGSLQCGQPVSQTPKRRVCSSTH